MAPTRSQPPRQQQAVTNTSYTANARSQDALSDFQARRLQRRLDELERTNPTDIPASSFVSQPQGVKPTEPAGAKKKQTGNVRRILYAKKSLKDWLDELPAEPKPPYYTAVVDPPTQPPRRICSSCGYTGAYKCPKCAEWSCDKNCMEIHERDGGCGIGG